MLLTKIPLAQITFVLALGFCQSPANAFLEELLLLITGDLETEFFVDGENLHMNSEITSSTPDQLKQIFAENPGITTIYMNNVPGSTDDEANLKAAAWIAAKELTFKLDRYSFIASGGTDFFLAGKRRIIEEGAQIGVHSWSGLTETATDFPEGHEYHLPYIEYYQAVGFSQQEAEDFYYYTINAAPSDDIYIMTDAEIQFYNIATEDLVTPAMIIPELEADRAEQGATFISEAEAKKRNIKIANIVSE